MIGMVGYGLSMLLFGLSTQLWMLFASRALSGILSSATLATAMAYVGDTTSEEDRGSGMGMLGAAGITTLLFYNQILGLSPSLCGLAFLISSIADAVSDPLVGTISDRYQSRWGRRHPFNAVSPQS